MVQGFLQIHDQKIVRQIRSVLRLSAGEKILLADGRGREALATIVKLTNRSVAVELERIIDNENEPTKHVVLYAAILKRENFELVVQKATEIGIKEIVPLITRRTVKLALKHDRLEKIIREAAEQSGRGMVPKLHQPMEFEEAITRAKGRHILFDVSGQILDSSFQISDSLGTWIGPEGGWEASEIEKALSFKFQVLSLGKLTLRAETAAIVAAYLAVH